MSAFAPTSKSSGGFTLLEVTITMLLATLLIVALAGLRQFSLGMVRNQQYTNSAVVVLQERLDLLRNQSWSTLATRSSAQTLLTATGNIPGALAALGPGATETITVASGSLGYPSAGGAPGEGTPPTSTYSITRTAAGGVSTSGVSSIDTNAWALDITASVTWTEGTRNRTRTMAVKVARQGVGK